MSGGRDIVRRGEWIVQNVQIRCTREEHQRASIEVVLAVVVVSVLPIKLSP
jgi:hypothetical protein